MLEKQILKKKKLLIGIGDLYLEMGKKQEVQ